MTRFEPLIGLTFSNAARSWRSCPNRHAQRLLVLPCQTTPSTATPSNLPDRHHLCRSGVMDTGTHFDRCHLRERGRHLALSYPSQDLRQCVGRLCLVEQVASPSQRRNNMYSLLLWPAFPQLKYFFGFADLVTAHACLGDCQRDTSSPDCSSPDLSSVSPLTDQPALARLISSTTRGLGAFHGISPEDAVRISCTAVSMPRTRNLWELFGPLAVLSSCKSGQAHNTAVQKVVSPLLSSSCGQ